MGKEIADGDSAFPILLKIPGALEQISVLVEDGRVDDELGRLTMFFGQLGLGVKTVHLRYAAIHVEEDCAAGFLWVVGSFGIERWGCATQVSLHKPGKRQGSKSHGAFLEKFSAAEHRPKTDR